MDESEKEILFENLNDTLADIIADKRKNPKNEEVINNFKARVNLGYQMDENDYFWCNLIAENGNYKLSRGKIDEYDLVLKVDPEDAMRYYGGEYSTLHMMTKKNRFGYKKLRIEKGSDGRRHLGIVLKFPKVFVLDKIKT